MEEIKSEFTKGCKKPGKLLKLVYRKAKKEKGWRPLPFKAWVATQIDSTDEGIKGAAEAWIFTKATGK